MRSANEVAVEAQLKYDYFFAAAILASLGFSIQLTLEHEKLTIVFYTVGLLAFAICAISCFYRLQQKPRIYELHAKADDERANNRVDTAKKAELKAKLFEGKYEKAYWIMCISFGLGTLAIAATKLSPLYRAVFFF